MDLLSSWMIRYLILAFATSGTSSVSLKYSAFSGLISEVTVDSQSIPIAIDFFSERSGLYAVEDCPAFIECARSKQPSDIFFGDFDIQGSIIKEIKPGNGCFMREVAGVLGFNRQSPILRGRTIISLSQSDVNGYFIELRSLHTTIPHDVTVPLLGSSDWVFTANISFGSMPMESRIRLDPGLDYIRFPVRLKRYILSLFSGNARAVSSGDTTIITCRNGDPPNLPDITLQFGDGAAITIPASTLRYPLVSTLSDCEFPIRVKFSPRDGDIVIGRQLLASVKSVILDAANSRIGFVRNDGYNEPSLPFARPHVPLFGDLSIIRDDTLGGVVRVELEAVDHLDPFEISGQYIMRWSDATPFDNQKMSGFYFEFISVYDPCIADSSTITLGEGETYTVEISRNAHNWRMDLVPAPNESIVTVHESTRGIDLYVHRMHPLVAIGDLKLPVPRPRIDPDGPLCTVCLSPIKTGDMEQIIEPCAHGFHLECIRVWLEIPNLNCPCCRAPVLVRDHS